MQKLTDEYETIYVSETAIKAIDVLLHKRKSLGNPTTVSTKSSWELFDDVVKIWEHFFPQEVENRLVARAIERTEERTSSQVLKDNGGIFLAAYPGKLFQLLKVVFPDQSWTDKKFLRKLVRLYPFLGASKHFV